MRNLDIHNLLITILALLLSIIPHEVAHGYMSYKLGDTTAKEDGRLSLNPLNYIDPLGLLSMILFKFGWAKAVPIDFSRIKGNKNVGIFLISIAGVAMNFIIAFVFSIFLSKALIAKDNFISEILTEIVWYNVMLGIFNLIPLPPLDGSKIIASFLPYKYQFYFFKYEKYFYIALIALIFSGFINNIIGPIILKIINFFINVGASFWINTGLI